MLPIKMRFWTDRLRAILYEQSIEKILHNKATPFNPHPEPDRPGELFHPGSRCQKPRRNVISFVNRVVHPYDSGVAIPDSFAQHVLPFAQCLLGRLSGPVDRDHPLFAHGWFEFVIN